MRIERFEEINAWQEARKLTNMVYEVTKHKNFAKDFGLTDQIRRAAISIMSNIPPKAGRKPKSRRFCKISVLWIQNSDIMQKDRQERLDRNSM